MEILDDSESLPIRGRGSTKYPWETWLKHGQTVRIFKGEDFNVNVVTMRQMIYQKAKAFGGRAATAVGRDARGRECVDVTYHAPIGRELSAEDEDDFDFVRETHE
jgi:hypothetical protein